MEPEKQKRNRKTRRNFAKIISGFHVRNTQIRRDEAIQKGKDQKQKTIKKKAEENRKRSSYRKTVRKTLGGQFKIGWKRINFVSKLSYTKPENELKTVQFQVKKCKI